MGGRVGAIVEQCWHRVPGGTARSTVASLLALAKRGDWEVVGISAWHRRAAAHTTELDKLIDEIGELSQMRMPRRLLYQSWHRLGRPHIARRTGQVDVLHATGGVIPPAGSAALVVTIHDLAFFRYPEYFTKAGVAFMNRAFALAKRHADVVLVPSRHTLNDCVAHGLAEQRMRVVPWGVAPKQVNQTDRVELRSRLKLPKEFILWVGTSEPRKNLETLLVAHQRAQHDVPLLLVGPRGWGMELDELLAKSSNVYHLGVLTNKDLQTLYDLAQVFVYPSLMEGFGMPVLEAMAQGTAVVTGATTSTAEVAGQAAVLVNPTDVDAIASAIDSLLEDDRFRKQLAASGAKRGATMTWQACATQIAAAYELVR